MPMDSCNNCVLFEDELMPLVRERLAAGQKVRYLPFRGVSMLPMLRQGVDAVELAPLPERLKKYDLPVYQYPSGKYVMHRVVKVLPDYYLCFGDNTYTPEHISRDQMVGVVSAFRRGEKRIEVTSFGYQLYCRFWHMIRPVRYFSVCCMEWLRRRLK